MPASSPMATANPPRIEPAPLQVESSDVLVRTVLALVRAAGVDGSAELSGDQINSSLNLTIPSSSLIRFALSVIPSHLSSH